ncbi:MAG: 3-phosphoshikimate 1-carboxyvinyltransferase [Gemmatimonadaceae bacterium]
MRALRVAGTIRVPGDKSISHRALMLGALADGRSTIRGILQSDDVASTARVLRALGAEIPALSDDMSFLGTGRAGLRSPNQTLDCGNSGTTARLIAGIVAGACVDATLIGDASLSTRPMARVARPLQQMGADVSFPATPDRLPMHIAGRALHGVHYASPTASAQIKSAVLLAAVTARITASVEEPQRSRDHSERMLRAMGVEMTIGDVEVAITHVPERLKPLEIDVAGDPSSAAYFLALGSLAQAGQLRLTNVLLNPTRIGFMDALRRMGARLHVLDERLQAGEPVGDVVVDSGHALVATEVNAPEVPSMIDELPLLACVASQAQGETVIRGAREMRVKESDRIAVTVANLSAIGVQSSELPDGLRVTGRQAPLRGPVATHDDHRIAMSFGILGALPGNEVVVDNPGCVTISYPDFWRDLERARAE